MVDKTREAENTELAWWLRRGFIGERAWKQAKYIGPGRTITTPRDFHGKFDLSLIHPKTGACVGVQVSTGEIRASRKAHGPPLYEWVPPSAPVEQWADAPAPGFYQVLTSIRDGVSTREWWMSAAKKRRKGKTGLDLFV